QARPGQRRDLTRPGDCREVRTARPRGPGPGLAGAGEGRAERERTRCGRATVERTEKDFAVAGELIQRAQAVDCPPWIKFRVYMAAGDIELKQWYARADRESARRALDLYTSAAQEAKRYGGEGYGEEGYDREGYGYQISPRVGLAYLGMGW